MNKLKEQTVNQDSTMKTARKMNSKNKSKKKDKNLKSKRKKIGLSQKHRNSKKL